MTYGRYGQYRKDAMVRLKCTHMYKLMNGVTLDCVSRVIHSLQHLSHSYHNTHLLISVKSDSNTKRCKQWNWQAEDKLWKFNRVSKLPRRETVIMCNFVVVFSIIQLLCVISLTRSVKFWGKKMWSSWNKRMCNSFVLVSIDLPTVTWVWDKQSVNYENNLPF